MFLSKNLKALRKFKSIDQDALATAIGVSRSAVGNYESGVREPELCKVVRMAEFFNVSLDDLIRKELVVSKEIVLRKNGEL